MTDPTDPKVFGPPLWRQIHKDALESDTREKQLAFITRLQERIRNIPCSTCRNHAQEYFDRNNILNVIGMRILGYDPSLSIFIWTWLFHNDVNKRIGKPILTIGHALSLYTSGYVPPIHNINNTQSLTYSANGSASAPGCSQKCQRAASN